MAERQYIAGRGLAVSTYLALRLQRPLFLEGEPGVGKTEVAKVLASTLDTELIRLQCYEGLDISHAVYEWNYPRQILEIRLLESAHALDPKPAARELFTDAFLIKRPLLRAIEQTQARPPVLLIDEIDRADEEFEGYLLELLSDFQITIPELGTIRAAEPPSSCSSGRIARRRLACRCSRSVNGRASWQCLPPVSRFTRSSKTFTPGQRQRPVRSAHGARRACRGRRTSASSPIASSNEPGCCWSAFRGAWAAAAPAVGSAPPLALRISARFCGGT
jgi:AAA domain (dynein-related subfamily)